MEVSNVKIEPPSKEVIDFFNADKTEKEIRASTLFKNKKGKGYFPRKLFSAYIENKYVSLQKAYRDDKGKYHCKLYAISDTLKTEKVKEIPYPK